jgi:hypothetical protein
MFSHVASIAAGNAGVPVIVDGFYYGRASGMAPRARYALNLFYTVALINLLAFRLGNSLMRSR